MEAIQIIQKSSMKDPRGMFFKLFNEAEFSAQGIEMEIKESYYTISKKDTIRGMHFQIPPYEQAKLVHVTAGSIVDVVVDLRRQSKNYGKYQEVYLKENQDMVYIPAGFAHGFQALEDHTIVNYHVTSLYSPEHDKGIRWDSFGYGWGGLVHPIMSVRDQNFISLDGFESPF